MLAPDLSQRVTIIETKVPYILDDLNILSSQIKDLDTKFDLLNTNVALIIDQRNKSEKALGRWKNVALSIIGSLTVLLIGFIAKVCWVVQTSKLTSF